MGANFMVRVFPCKRCIVFPMCLIRYEKWKKIIYKKHPSLRGKISVIDYGINLFSQCKYLNDYMYKPGKVKHEKRIEILTRKFDG